MASFTTDGKICIERQIEAKHDQECSDLFSRFNIEGTCQWIKENKYLKVCLQFPDDLLGVSARIYEEIKKCVDVDLYILGDTSYASCCVDSVAAMHVQGDAVVHYGHSCFSKTDIPVFTVLPRKDLDVEAMFKVLKDNFNSDDNVKFCLFYAAEYEHCKEIISEYWFKQYRKSYLASIHIAEKTNRFLGRAVTDISGEEFSKEILKDCICIYAGTRDQTMFNFTVSVAASKWYQFNPDTCKLEQREETAWFKRRRYLIERCKDADVIGILVCKLAGDQTKDIIARMKKLCKVNGKKSYIVSVGKPNVAKLANFPEIQIYVMIACPENDLYNTRDFYTPIVYPYDLEVALNSNRDSYFTSHIIDYDDLLPGKGDYFEIDRLKEETDVSLITGKIRETKVDRLEGTSADLVEKQNWALESIGQNLQQRSWKGLEQKLGETEVKKVEVGRKGIALQYSNEPE